MTNNNNCVAETDYRAALASMENRFNQENEFVRQAGASLKKHLDRIVQPIDDERYHELLRDESAMDEEEEETEDEEDSEIEEEESEEEEVDEEALVDELAVERVRQLRQEVRDASVELATLAESVTDTAVALAEQEIDLVRGNISVPPAPSVEPNAPGPVLDSLVSLTASLEKLDLPKASQMLEDTIGTVERSFQPEQLSQTERAIRSRSNEGRVHHSNENEPPEQRLASFLEQH